MSEIQALDLSADRALFTGKIKTIIATVYENEKPLGGLGGLLDWRLFGAISDSIRRGVITGKKGECSYFPVTRNDVTFHVLLVGAGESSEPGARDTLPSEAVKALQKNLASLHPPKVGLSRADFGGASDEALARQFKGIPLWIAP